MLLLASVAHVWRRRLVQIRADRCGCCRVRRAAHGNAHQPRARKYSANFFFFSYSDRFTSSSRIGIETEIKNRTRTNSWCLDWWTRQRCWRRLDIAASFRFRSRLYPTQNNVIIGSPGCRLDQPLIQIRFEGPTVERATTPLWSTHTASSAPPRSDTAVLYADLCNCTTCEIHTS